MVKKMKLMTNFIQFVEKLKGILFILIVLLISQASLAQPTQKGVPVSIREKMDLKNIPHLKLKKLDSETELKKVREEGCYDCFGKVIEVDVDFKKVADFQLLPDSSKLWRYKISSETAKQIKCYFDKFKLPKGAKIFFFNEDTTIIDGAYTERHNDNDEKFIGPGMRGNTIIIEYYEPKNVLFDGILHINWIGHDYVELAPTGGPSGSSSACNLVRDIECMASNGLSGWDSQIASVAMITFVDLGSGNRIKGSGSLLNKTSPDGTPFFLTAHHLIEGKTIDYTNWEFDFNLEYTACQGSIVSAEHQIVKKASFITGSTVSDFLLLQLDKTPFPDGKICYNGWDRTGSISDLPIVSIHHPAGDAKKYAAEKTTKPSKITTVSGVKIWYIYDMDEGALEGGSSGSPLYDDNKHLIGQTNGVRDKLNPCNNPRGTGFGRFSESWVAGGLSNWLGNANTVDSYCPAKLIASYTPSSIVVNVGQDVTFNNSSSGGIGTLTSFWDFGDGSPASILTNPTHSFSIARTYAVVLTTIDSKNNMADYTDYIIVVGPLISDFTASINNVNVGSNVVFTNTSSGGLAPYSYSWNFGTGASPATANTEGPHSVTYSTTGLKTISLTVTDDNGTSDVETKTNYISVTVDALVVDFSADNTFVFTGDNVTFTPAVSGGLAPYTYSWNFGAAGVPATENNEGPHYVYYNSSGQKTISLTVTDALGTSNTKTKANYITVDDYTYPLVNNGFTYYPASPTITDMVSFSPSSATGGVPPYTYLWDFDDGNTSADHFATHTFATSGSYTVLFKVNDANGDYATTSQNIFVSNSGSYTVDFNASNTTVPFGQTINFTANASSVNYKTFYWDFNNDGTADATTTGTTSSIYNNYSYSSQGTFSVTLTVDDGFNSVSVTKNNYITVGPNTSDLVIEDFGLGNCDGPSGNPYVTSFVTGGVQDFTSPPQTSSGSPFPGEDYFYQYSWSNEFNASGFFKQPHEPYSYLDINKINTTYPGSYPKTFLVKLRVEDNNFPTHNVTRAQAYVTIYADFTVSMGSLQLCPNTSSVLYSNVSGAVAPYTYNWYKNGVSLPNSTSFLPVTSPAASSSSDTYRLVVDDDWGCRQVEKSVSVSSTELIADAGTDKVLCLGKTTTIGENPSGGSGGYIYQWSPPTNLSASNVKNPIVTPTTVGNIEYTMRVTDANGCIDEDKVLVSARQTFTVADAGADQTVEYCYGSALLGGLPPAYGGSGLYDFSWSPTTNLTFVYTTPSNPLAIPASAGSITYTMTVTDLYSTCITSDQVVVTADAPAAGHILTADAGTDKQSEICKEIGLGGTPAAFGGSGGYTYEWTPDNHLSSTTVSNPKVTPMADKPDVIYTLKVTDIFTTCSATDQVEVKGTLISGYSVDAGEDIELCGYNNGTGPPSLEAHAIVPPNTIYSFLWSNGATTPILSGRITNTNPPTTLGVSLLVNECVMAYDEVTIINTNTNNIFYVEIPQVNGNLFYDGICQGDAAQLSVNVLGGSGNYLYEWFPADDLNDPAIYNPIATPLTSKSYFVKVTDLTYNCICYGSDAIYIDVFRQNPIVDFEIVPPACEDLNTYFINTSDISATPVSPYKYFQGFEGASHWDFGQDATPQTFDRDYKYQNFNIEKSISVKYNTPGSKIITMTLTNGCGSSTVQKQVEIMPSTKVDEVKTMCDEFLGFGGIEYVPFQAMKIFGGDDNCENIVDVDAQVHYWAGEEIVLKNFTAYSGSKFEAVIQPCYYDHLAPPPPDDNLIFSDSSSQNQNLFGNSSNLSQKNNSIDSLKNNAVTDAKNKFICNPNPFMDNTIIQYLLVNTYNVSITIQNILGQNFFSILNNRTQTAGNYSFTLNTYSLPAGIYFCTFEAKSEKGEVFKENKKLVKLR